MSQSSNKAMNTTPEITKSTPYRSTGITKTLLTPCRRLGLSRKIKVTPTSHNTSLDSTSATFTPSSTPSPASTLKFQESSLATAISKENRKPPARRSIGLSSRANIQSRFQTDDIDRPSDNSFTSEYPKKNASEYKMQDANEPKQDHKKSRQKKQVQKQNKWNASDTDTEDTNRLGDDSYTSECAKTNDIECKIQNADKPKKKLRKLRQKKEVQEQNASNVSDMVPWVNLNKDYQSIPTCIESSEQNSSPIRKSVEMLEENQITAGSKHFNTDSRDNCASRKTFKRCLSMKKNSCSQDELTDMDDLLSTPKTSVSSLLSGEFLNDCNVNEDQKVELIGDESDEQINFVSNKSRKKRCVVYSSDEDDFVPFQESDVSGKLQNEDWHGKVAEIKTRIKRKERHLSELKQAAVYKKLHNVEELKQSTNLWKKCCEDSLMRLLPKLQEHGPMDMFMLMKNLNIPKNIIFDVNTESFIN